MAAYRLGKDRKRTDAIEAFEFRPLISVKEQPTQDSKNDVVPNLWLTILKTVKFLLGRKS